MNCAAVSTRVPRRRGSGNSGGNFNEDVRARVQEYKGYTLLGDTRFQRVQFWIGQGANGKGTPANIVQALHNRTAAVQLDDLGGFKTRSSSVLA